MIKLQIWDTCGQEFYKSLVSSFYRNTSLAIIVYAIDDQKSFDDLDLWIKDLKMNSSPDIKIFLIGNKSDLNDERVISKEMAQKVKDEYDLDFFIETSAKNGINTKELFINCATILYEENQSLLNEMNGDKIIDNSKINYTLDKSDIYEETDQCNC